MREMQTYNLGEVERKKTEKMQGEREEKRAGYEQPGGAVRGVRITARVFLIDNRTEEAVPLPESLWPRRTRAVSARKVGRKLRKARRRIEGSQRAMGCADWHRGGQCCTR